MLGNDSESVALLNSYTTLRNYTRGLEDAREASDFTYTELITSSEAKLRDTKARIIQKIKEVRQ